MRTTISLFFFDFMAFNRALIQINAKQKNALAFAPSYVFKNDCQVRGEHKLYFHWNIVLTVVNIAKIDHWIPQKDKRKCSFFN